MPIHTREIWYRICLLLLSVISICLSLEAAYRNYNFLSLYPTFVSCPYGWWNDGTSRDLIDSRCSEICRDNLLIWPFCFGAIGFSQQLCCPWAASKLAIRGMFCVLSSLSSLIIAIKSYHRDYSRSYLYISIIQFLIFGALTNDGTTVLSNAEQTCMASPQAIDPYSPFDHKCYVANFAYDDVIQLTCLAFMWLLLGVFSGWQRVNKVALVEDEEEGVWVAN